MAPWEAPPISGTRKKLSGSAVKVQEVQQTLQRPPLSLVVSRAPLSTRVTRLSTISRQSGTPTPGTPTSGGSLSPGRYGSESIAASVQPSRGRPQHVGNARPTSNTSKEAVPSQRRPQSAGRIGSNFVRAPARQRLRSNSDSTASSFRGSTLEVAIPAPDSMERASLGLCWTMDQSTQGPSQKIAGEQWLQILERRLAEGIERPVGAIAEDARPQSLQAGSGGGFVPVMPLHPPRTPRPGSAPCRRRPQSAGRQPPQDAAEYASERRNREKLWRKEQQELVVRGTVKAYGSRDSGLSNQCLVKDIDEMVQLDSAVSTFSGDACDDAWSSDSADEIDHGAHLCIKRAPPIQGKQPRRRHNTPGNSVEFCEWEM